MRVVPQKRRGRYALHARSCACGAAEASWSLCAPCTDASFKQLHCLDEIVCRTSSCLPWAQIPSLGVHTQSLHVGQHTWSVSITHNSWMSTDPQPWYMHTHRLHVGQHTWSVSITYNSGMKEPLPNYNHSSTLHSRICIFVQHYQLTNNTDCLNYLP